MNTTAAKPPRPLLRLNQRATLLPPAQFAEWHELASATAGLTDLDRQVLDVIAGYYRRLQAEGFASFPSIEQMALSSGVRPIDITGAIKRLVSLALLAVRPGSGRWRNEYLMCLPKRVIAEMSALALDEAPPF
jgi:hypothetical protein